MQSETFPHTASGADGGAHWTAADMAEPPAWEGTQGIYFIPRQVFFGDVIMYQPRNARAYLSLLDGPDHLPQQPNAFDAECLRIAQRMLEVRKTAAPLFVPISFGNLVRSSCRDAYKERLAELPESRRSDLAAMIYDVPRDPALVESREAHAMLDRHFSTIDLRTTDPAFEIERLPRRSVTSVTLMLPNADPFVRLSAMRRFADRMPIYKHWRIWPAVSNVRRAAEVEMAARLGIPFVTGPAVCGPMTNAVGGRTAGPRSLPAVCPVLAPMALAS